MTARIAALVATTLIAWCTPAAGHTTTSTPPPVPPATAECPGWAWLSSDGIAPPAWLCIPADQMG